MKVELDPFDLRSEFTRGGAAEKNFDQAINTRDVTFDKLNDKAQQVVRAAGRAVFYAFDRMTYNAVYPPQGTEVLNVQIEIKDGRATKVLVNGEEPECLVMTEKSWTIFPHLDEETDMAYNLILVESIT